jgi:hypothetical protein
MKRKKWTAAELNKMTRTELKVLLDKAEEKWRKKVKK